MSNGPPPPAYGYNEEWEEEGDYYNRGRGRGRLRGRGGRGRGGYYGGGRRGGYGYDYGYAPRGGYYEEQDEYYDEPEEYAPPPGRGKTYRRPYMSMWVLHRIFPSSHGLVGPCWFNSQDVAEGEGAACLGVGVEAAGHRAVAEGATTRREKCDVPNACAY